MRARVACSGASISFNLRHSAVSAVTSRALLADSISALRSLLGSSCSNAPCWSKTWLGLGLGLGFGFGFGLGFGYLPDEGRVVHTVESHLPLHLVKVRDRARVWVEG